MATGNVKIRCVETNITYDIPISASVIKRPTVAVVLSLDVSGSMADDAGDGRTKSQVLVDAVAPFIDLAPDADGVGIVTFDQDAHNMRPIELLGDVFGAGRADAHAAISSYAANPLGTTSIGDGVERAHTLLSGATGFDAHAMVVLTDGLENTPKFIKDVSGSIDETVFAIGLGKPENISTVALDSLAGSKRGTLLITGKLSKDDHFRLQKFYLQILAGLTNKQIVQDPDNVITIGEEHRIPFVLTDADIDTDVILLTPQPALLDFQVETPSGTIIDPAGAAAVPGGTFVRGHGIDFYRFTLPVVTGGETAQAGIWHALVRVGDRFDATVRYEEQFRRGYSGSLPYSVSVHAYSNVRMAASLTQTSREPGAPLNLRAAVTESSLPLENVEVRAEIRCPDLTRVTVGLDPIAPGVHQVSTADGRTLSGQTFRREQILTGAVWPGGDTVQDPGRDHPASWICHLADCLIEDIVDPRGAEWLAAHGVHLDRLRHCVHQLCQADKSNEDGRFEIMQALAKVLTERHPG